MATYEVCVGYAADSAAGFLHVEADGLTTDEGCLRLYEVKGSGRSGVFVAPLNILIYARRIDASEEVAWKTVETLGAGQERADG